MPWGNIGAFEIAVYGYGDMKRSELEEKIKGIVLSSLNLEELGITDISADTPLFDGGIGLDSIDALELGIALKKEFDLEFKSGQNKEHFYSIKSLTDFVAASKGIDLE